MSGWLVPTGDKPPLGAAQDLKTTKRSWPFRP